MALSVGIVCLKRNQEYEDIGDDQQPEDDDSQESEKNNEHVEDKEALQLMAQPEIKKDEHFPPIVIATNDHDLLVSTIFTRGLELNTGMFQIFWRPCYT